MSLPERGRGPRTYRELGVRTYRNNHGIDSRHPYLKVRDAYLETTTLKCRRLLESSGVLAVLSELNEQEKVSVRMEEEEAETLGTTLELTWGFGRDGLRRKSMHITALPVTDDIVVQGAVAAVIPQEVWSAVGGKNIVRDLILNAYHHPEELE